MPNIYGGGELPPTAPAPSAFDLEVSVNAAGAVKKKRRVYSEKNTDPISAIFGINDPAQVQPALAEDFIKLQGLKGRSELELSAPKTLVGIEVEVENVLRIDPNIPLMFWSIKEDGSLRNNGREFVTPGVIPVSYAEAALTQLFKGLNESIDFSQRTSIHVHMDARQLTLQQAVAFVLTYATVENLLFKFVGNNRRSNIFCVPITETGVMQNMGDNPTRFMWSVDQSWTKYTALNLLPIMTLGSIEFRHMPGTNNIQKLMVWLDLISRLKTFVYRSSYNDIVDSIGQLNSNSRYRQFVENLFGPMSTYLDMAHLATDMEKPCYIVKNCAAANKWDHEVMKVKDIKGSQLYDKWYAKIKHLNKDQMHALGQLAEALGQGDLTHVFDDLLIRGEKYIKSYPHLEPWIRSVLNPKVGTPVQPAVKPDTRYKSATQQYLEIIQQAQQSQTAIFNGDVIQNWNPGNNQEGQF